MKNFQKHQKTQTISASNQLGTFGAVFTPSILTIFGVIMFMRTGYVIGEAGIFYLLMILLISKSITLLTSLSISAVSTNTPVAGGGAYFLISRSLGPGFGGTIGLVLFCAQAISVPFYVLGYTEAVARTFPDLSDSFQTIAIFTTLALFAIAYIGAKWALKMQYLIMTILGLSIVAFLGGAATHFQPDLFKQNWHFTQYSGTYSFSIWGCALGLYVLQAAVKPPENLKNAHPFQKLATNAAGADGQSGNPVNHDPVCIMVLKRTGIGDVGANLKG